MRFLGIPLVVVALVATSCGGSKPDPKPAEPETLTVSGDLTLIDSGIDYLAGMGCWGTGGYDDMQEGASVVVYGANGDKIAVGSLGAGHRDGPVTCIFDFEVTDVPADDKVMSVEISHRGEYTFKVEDSESIHLSLG